MTSFKWKRFGKRYVVFGNEADEDGNFPIIWEATEGVMSKQTLKKEMKIFLKDLKKQKKALAPDEEDTETDD